MLGRLINCFSAGFQQPIQYLLVGSGLSGQAASPGWGDKLSNEYTMCVQLAPACQKICIQLFNLACCKALILGLFGVCIEAVGVETP